MKLGTVKWTAIPMSSGMGVVVYADWASGCSPSRIAYWFTPNDMHGSWMDRLRQMAGDVERCRMIQQNN